MTTIRQVEERLSELPSDLGHDLVFELLKAYGLSPSSVGLLKAGSYNKSSVPGEVIWQKRVRFRFTGETSEDLHALVDELSVDEQTARFSARFVVASNGRDLVALDMRTGDPLDIPVDQLPRHAAFFMPWAGVERVEKQNANLADIKAAEKLGTLYDELVGGRELLATDRHELNVFFVRLLFCFFAEDTGVLPTGSFTGAVSGLTDPSGSDVGTFLDSLFSVLGTSDGKRRDLPEHFARLPYVGGELFDRQSPTPQLSRKARQIIIEAGSLDWTSINPDIFGSLMQAVVEYGERADLGMHYTSVENILRVLKPLFLEDLEEKLEAATSATAVNALIREIGDIRILDPACGSGNFLVIAYKELRRLEARAVEKLADLSDGGDTGQIFASSSVRLAHFFGIEIGDFECEVANVALWIAKYQANQELQDTFQAEESFLPLKDAGAIHHRNAVRFNWTLAVPLPRKLTVYVVGNPPYVGSSNQTEAQKSDFANYFGTERYPRNLDYVALWFLKGAEYAVATGARVGFVATSSISQGDHCALLWPLLFSKGVEIAFAHEPFAWSNSARGQAGVTCTVVGIAENVKGPRKLISAEGVRQVRHIGPYLIPMKSNTVVTRAGESVSGLPAILRGNQASDWGQLMLSSAEREELIESDPDAEQFIRRFVGAEELLQGHDRFCLWIPDDKAAAAARNPIIARRFEALTEQREKGSVVAKALADKPHRFAQRPHLDEPFVIIPSTTSERRDYLPVDVLDADTIPSHGTYVVYGAELWVFSLVSSAAHMLWLRIVGGHLKRDLRYSNLVYDSFPVPKLSQTTKVALEESARTIIEERESELGATLAELYDPDKMPPALHAAHTANDALVESLYEGAPFRSDERRLEALFALYEELTGINGDSADA